MAPSNSSSSAGEGTTSASNHELSTYEILEAAARRIIGMSSQSIDLCSLRKNPFDLSSRSGLSYQEATKVELVEYLMAAAENVGSRRHDQALDLLDLCHCLSSKTGDPIQRVVHYFSESLRERISRQSPTRRIDQRSRTGQAPVDSTTVNGGEEWLKRVAVPIVQSIHEKIPFYRVSHMAGIQILLENVGGSRRIHVIDLEIRNGMQWTAMMQALTSRWDRPVELFKITAVGPEKSRKSIEDAGRWLTSFAAQTMSSTVTFCFRIVTVDDVLDLQEEMFDVDPREALVVYSEFYLRSLIPSPDRMEGLMRVIRGLRPRIMAVLEMESNHNSTTLAHRFVEALFSFASVFDCLEVCMDEGDAERRVMFEFLVIGRRIRNVVVEEGEDRCFRTVRIDVWRTLFARFGMVESKLSAMILYQAKLVLKEFPCGKYCKIGVNGRSLIAGWKETPMISISSWKFARLRKLKEDEVSG